jgi:hypothetical protein
VVSCYVLLWNHVTSDVALGDLILGYYITPGVPLVDVLLLYHVTWGVALVDLLLWYHVTSGVALFDMLLWYHVTTGIILVDLLLWYRVTSIQSANNDNIHIITRQSKTNVCLSKITINIITLLYVIIPYCQFSLLPFSFLLLFCVMVADFGSPV